MHDKPLGENKWSTAGASIMAAERLAAVRRHLEEIGFVVVLWWHYYGSRAPTRLTFDSYDEFEGFLRTQPRQGDAIDVWPFPTDPAARIATERFRMRTEKHLSVVRTERSNKPLHATCEMAMVDEPAL